MTKTPLQALESAAAARDEQFRRLNKALDRLPTKADLIWIVPLAVFAGLPAGILVGDAITAFLVR